MSSSSVPPAPACDDLVPLLPLLDTSGLSADEERTVHAHLAGCSRCRARVAAYDLTESALRRHAGLDAASDPVPLVSFDDVLRAVAQEEATPAPTIPPTHTASRRLSGIAAIAAVLLIAVFAQLVFSSRNSQGNHPAPFDSAALAHAIVYAGTGGGIYAIHAATGKLAWRYPATDLQPPEAYVTSCLTLTSTVLYACSPDGIIAVRASDGTLLWHRALPDASSVLDPPTQGHFPSLGIAGGAIYVSTVAGGGLGNGEAPVVYAIVALSAASGTVLWRHVADEPLRSAPAVAHGAVYVATSNHLEALSSRDGTLLWRSPLGGAAPQGTTPTGVYDAAITATDTAVYVSTLEDLSKRPASSQGSASLIATPFIYQISSVDGSHIWKAGYPSCACMSPRAPIIWNGDVYYAEDNSLWQLSARGTNLGWRFTGYGELVGPVLAGGVLYLTDTGQDPNTLDSDTLALDPATDQALWRTGTQDGLMSLPPAVADGAVFSGGGTLLYALRADTGGVLWRFQTGGNMQISPPVISP